MKALFDNETVLENMNNAQINPVQANFFLMYAVIKHYMYSLVLAVLKLCFPYSTFSQNTIITLLKSTPGKTGSLTEGCVN